MTGSSAALDEDTSFYSEGDETGLVVVGWTFDVSSLGIVTVGSATTIPSSQLFF